jgi:acetylornithine deacetylase/succinyl-diaminopimelate desuccinylase-like protein
MNVIASLHQVCRGHFMRGSLLVLLFSLVPLLAWAQGNPAALAAHEWRQQHERAILDEFFTLLSIPNIASDKGNIQRNAELIATMMEKRGIAAQLVSVPGGNPIVFGEIRVPQATRTLVFYAHYDGQPLDLAEWASAPFEPILRTRVLQEGGVTIPLPAAGTPIDPEARIYARGAGDDKAPVVALLAALDAIQAAGIQMQSNIKFAFEGEEEAGSPNLARTLEANKELFAGDIWLMCDAPLHQTRQQSIIFGARGIAVVDITLYGARGELHSGHYGNWAPNPALNLARLLVSIKDESGRVVVDGFYDDVEPLGELERRAIAEAPDIDALLMEEFLLGETENSPRSLMDLITQPSLNIRGMASSRIGNQASNVIPASATATIDMRLVKGMDPQSTIDRLVEHIKAQGFHVVTTEPDAATRLAHPRIALVTVRPGASLAVRTPMDLPLVQEVIRVVESARGPAVLIPTMGGNLPLESIERSLDTKTLIIPISNHDNNQHSFDENLRVQNLWDGIELMAALLTM